MSQLEWHGLPLPTQYMKELSGDIYELRPEYDGIENRLYFGVVGNEAICCHADTKVPKKEEQRNIALAQRRFNEWKDKR